MHLEIRACYCQVQRSFLSHKIGKNRRKRGEACSTTASPPSLCERLPKLSVAVEKVVLKALAKDPTERFESVQAFALALEKAA